MVKAWTEAAFVYRYPKAFHLSEAGSWPNIERLGLLSTSTLLDRFEVEPAKRRLLESHRRPDLVVLEHPQLGRAVLRDQKPLSESKLASCLDDGVTVEQWLRLINAHTFFWVDELRVSVLKDARAYRTRRQLRLTLDTETLLRENSGRVFITDRNTGTTTPFAHRRGLGTFAALPECDSSRRVVELAVRDSLLNTASCVRRVDEIGGDAPPVLLFERPTK